MEGFQYEIMGFRFKTVQLIRVERDGTVSRELGTKALKDEIEAGNAVMRSIENALHISYKDKEVFVPLLAVSKSE